MSKYVDKICIKANVNVVFADLDDTLITTATGAKFPTSEWDWRPKFEVWQAIKELNPKWLCIVSNQGGIELGYVKEHRYVAKLEAVVKQLSLYLPETYVTYKYCTSNDKTARNRKPNIGMFLDTVEANPQLMVDCTSLLMIGDASGCLSTCKDQRRSEDYDFLQNITEHMQYNRECHYMDVNEFCYRMIGFEETAKYACLSFDSMQAQLKLIKEHKAQLDV